MDIEKQKSLIDKNSDDLNLFDTVGNFFTKNNKKILTKHGMILRSIYFYN